MLWFFFGIPEIKQNFLKYPWFKVSLTHSGLTREFFMGCSAHNTWHKALTDIAKFWSSTQCSSFTKLFPLPSMVQSTVRNWLESTWYICMNDMFTGPISVSNLISIERTPLPSSDKPPLSIMHAEMKTCHTFMLSFLLMKWSQSLISCMLMHLINKNINRSCLCLSVLLSKLEDVIKRPKNQK